MLRLLSFNCICFLSTFLSLVSSKAQICHSCLHGNLSSHLFRLESFCLWLWYVCGTPEICREMLKCILMLTILFQPDSLNYCSYTSFSWKTGLNRIVTNLHFIIIVKLIGFQVIKQQIRLNDQLLSFVYLDQEPSSPACNAKGNNVLHTTYVQSTLCFKHYLIIIQP